MSTNKHTNSVSFPSLTTNKEDILNKICNKDIQISELINTYREILKPAQGEAISKDKQLQ